jgi:hypothetical protein
MMLRYVSLHNRYFMLPADVPDQIPHACCDLARRYFVIHTRCKWISNTVVRTPTYSIPALYPARTRSKPSPEGEGFNPPSQRQ